MKLFAVIGIFFLAWSIGYSNTIGGLHLRDTLRVIGLVFGRFANGDTDLSLWMLSRLDTTDTYFRRLVVRSLSKIAIDDDEVFLELERRAAKGIRDLSSERIRRRFRVRRGLPVFPIGERAVAAVANPERAVP